MPSPILTRAGHFCVLLTEFPNLRASEPRLPGMGAGVCTKKGFTRFHVCIMYNTLIRGEFGQPHLPLSSRVSPSPAHHAHRGMSQVVRSQAGGQELWAV